MKCFTFVLLISISLPIAAQNWAAIGTFNHGILSLSSDTLTDELNITGVFSKFDEDTIAGLGRWNGSTMTSYGCGIDWNCITPIIPGSFYPQVYDIIRYNGDVFVTGVFNYAGGVSVNCLARWDGLSWSGFGSGIKEEGGMNGVGLGLKEILGDLYVFGHFDSIAGIHANSIAKYDGVNWSDVNNFPLVPTYPGAANWIYDIALYDNELYACGNFSDAPNGTIFNITKWDGSEWVSIGNGINGSVIDVRKMLIYKDELIVAGRFSKSVDPNNPGENIAKWDGSQWSELSSGTDDIIWDMVIHDDTLYACGAFQHAGGVDAPYLARWDGMKWCGYGTAFNSVISCLEFYRDTLYVGGSFNYVGSDSIWGLAKWIGGNYIDTCGIESGIEQVVNIETLTVFPNPLHTTATIVLPFELICGTLKFYNLLGQEVMSIEGITGKEILISRDGLSNGLYFFRVTDGQVLIGQGKIVVE